MYDDFAAVGLPADPVEMERIAACAVGVTAHDGYFHRIWAEPSGLRVHITNGPHQPNTASTPGYRAVAYAGGPTCRVVPISARAGAGYPLAATLTLQPATGIRPDNARFPAVAVDLAHTMRAYRKGSPVDVRLTCWPVTLGTAERASAPAPTGDGVRFAGMVVDDRPLVNAATGRAYRIVVLTLPGSDLAFAVCAPFGADPYAPGSLVAVEGRLVVAYAGGASGLVPVRSGLPVRAGLAGGRPSAE